MDNLEVYKREVDTIFAGLSQLEIHFPDKDNINFINNIREYQEEVVSYKKNIEKLLAERVGESANDR